MKDINLISFRIDDKTKKSKKNIITALVLSAIVIFMSFGTLTILTKKNNIETAETKKAMNKFAEVNTLKGDIRLYNEKIKQMKDVLDAVSDKSVINTKLLQEIAKAMPDDVYITNYSVSKTGDISLVGKSANNESIAYFRYKLDESKQFSDIAVKSIKSDSSGDKKSSNNAEMHTFDISLKLKR